MESDIHFYVEEQTETGWAFVEEIKLSRNYALFGILAGEKSHYVPLIHAPKGFPQDASNVVRGYKNDWKSLANSHSWLTLKELMSFDWDQLYDEYDTLHTHCEEFYRRVIECLTHVYKNSPDKVRVVFWFDE